MNATTKRLALALALSLSANLFVAGFFVARAFYRGSLHHHPGFHGPFLGPQAMMHDQRGPLADAIRGAMKRHGDAFRVQRAQLRDARRAVHAAMTAEPYDAQALGRALSQLRDKTAESQRLMHDVVLELAGTLGPEQRRALLRDAPALARDWGEPDGM
jgi:Spy/CpxP family protein refolding chaperone